MKKNAKITKKVFVVGESIHYASFIEGAQLVDNIEDANIVIFTGGEDVSPKLYNRDKDPTTYSNPNRDAAEVRVYNSIKPNQLCIGVCRGSQLMCVLNGGVLAQDVSGHAMFGTHPIITSKKEIYEITSTHHQMQYPYNLDSKYYDVIATAHPFRSDRYDGLTEEERNMVLQNGEPEIVHYHLPNKPQALAIQGHPEMMRPNSPTVEWLNELIECTLSKIVTKK